MLRTIPYAPTRTEADLRTTSGDHSYEAASEALSDWDRMVTF